MANPFDQFDATAPAAPAAAPAQAANPFDRFDAPKGPSNPFDAFDPEHVAGIADPVAHASQFDPGHPEYEAAFQADQARKNRPLSEKIGAAASTATTLTPWIEGAKGIGKFVTGLGLTAFDTARQLGDTAIGAGASAIGADQTATDFQNKAQQLRAENILAAQSNEENLRNVARIAKQNPIATNIATAGMAPIVQPFVQPDDDRTDFANRIQHFKNQQTLASGTPLDTGVVSAITPNNGEPLSSTFSPAGLAATGAEPVRPLAVEMKTAASDPANLLLAEAPGLPGARTIAGGGVELAGKAMQLPGRGLDYLGGKLGKLGAAIDNPIALAGETGLAMAVHPPSAAVVGSALGAKLAQRVGEVLEAQGNEFRTGIPSTLTEAAAAAQDAGKSAIGTNLARAAGDTVVRGAATAYGFVPVNAVLSEGDPEEFTKSEIGAGIFGAGLGALHARPSMRAMDAALQGKLMEQHGAGQFSDDPAYAAHQQIVSGFTPENQSAINRLRSFLFGGTGTDVLVVDGNTFAQKAADADKASGGTGQAAGTGARGVYLPSADGSTIYLNADALATTPQEGQRKAIDTAGHETGHAVVKWLSDASREADAQGMMKAISDRLSDTDKSTMANAYWDALEKSTKGVTPANRDAVRAKIQQDHPMPKIIEENLAEVTRSILGGKDVSQFALPKPIESKVMDGASRMLESLGISAPIDPNATLGFKGRMVKEAARRMQDMLYDVGVASRANRAMTTPQMIRELQRQMDAIPKYDDKTPFSKAQEYTEQMASLQKRLDAAERIRRGEIDQQSATASPAAPQGNAAALAAVRNDARTALIQLGYKAGQINQWINQAYQQHGGPIEDTASLVKAALRIQRGGTVQPGEFTPKPATPPAPATPITAPTGDKATFRDEQGNAKTITGLTPDNPTPNVGDIVVTREGEIRRVTRALGNTVDTARPIDPLNARGTKTHNIADVAKVEHDYAQPSAGTQETPAPTQATAEAAPTPDLRVVPSAGGRFQIVDAAGNPVSKVTFASESDARQSIARTGKPSTFGLPPSANGNDIIDAIMEEGGIHFGKMLKEEVENEFPHKGIWRNSLSTSNPDMTPDEVARLVQDRSHGDGTPGTMFAEITKAIEGRTRLRDQQGAEEKRQKSEAKTTPQDEQAPPASNEPLPTEHGGTVISAPGSSETSPPVPLPQSPDVGDFDRIAAQAREAFLSDKTPAKAGKNKGQHTQENQRKADKAAFDAAADAHAATAPLNYEGMRLRTDGFGKRTVSGTVDPSRPFDAWLIQRARASGNLPREALNNLMALQDAIGTTVSYDYGHAPVSDEGDMPTNTGRARQQAEHTVAKRLAGESPQQVTRKNSVPLRVGFNSGTDSFTVYGVSQEKLLNNFNHLSEKMGDLEMPLPFRDINDPRFVAAFKNVIANHENGWKGDGSAPAVPTQDFPFTPNPDWRDAPEHQIVPKEQFEFINALLGDESMKSGSPEAKAKAHLANENEMAYDPTGEANELRYRINAATPPVDGKTWSKATIEDPLNENISPALVNDIGPASQDDESIRQHGKVGDLGRFFPKGKTPNRAFTSAAFMPSEEGPTIDESDPAWIQRFEALSQKEYRGNLTPKEDDEIDELQQRIVKQFGSLNAYQKARNAEGKTDIHEPLRAEMRKTPQQRAQERINARFMPEEDREPFYSQLTRTIQSLPQETMTAAQAAGQLGEYHVQREIMVDGKKKIETLDRFNPLDKAKADALASKEGAQVKWQSQKGVKEDEVAQQGIFTDPLSPLYGKSDTDKVSKSDLAGYSIERAAKVQDVTLGGENTEHVIFQDNSGGKNNNKWFVADDVSGTPSSGKYHVNRGDAENELRHIKGFEWETSFSQYQLPGADEGSYREMFVTWPKETEEQRGNRRVALGDASNSGRITTEQGNAALDSTRNQPSWEDGHEAYSSIENPIVRIRRNIRTDANGNRVYFIEEMQGPNSDNQAKMPPEVRKRIYEIGMKRALRDAVDEGASKLAWTTGEQQAARYDLSKSVNEIRWTPEENGEPGYLLAYDHNGKKVIDVPKLDDADLEKYVGKEAAQKLNSPSAQKGNSYQEISGDDLKVGGEGLKRLYDQTLPRIANDLAKKFGAKVKSNSIDPARGGDYSVVRRDGKWIHVDKEGNKIGEFDSEQDALNTDPGFIVHSLEIPDALRTQQRQGNPLFMPDTGTPEEGNTPGERLAREAEQAGVVLNVATLKGLIQQDEDTMNRVRARIQQNTGNPARFMPDEDTSKYRHQIADGWKGTALLEDTKAGDDYNYWIDAKQDILHSIKIPDGWTLKDASLHTKWGSAYMYVESPDEETYKFRIGDHNASPSRASENDYSYQVSKPATLKSWAKAADRVEDELAEISSENPSFLPTSPTSTRPAPTGPGSAPSSPALSGVNSSRDDKRKLDVRELARQRMREREYAH